MHYVAFSDYASHTHRPKLEGTGAWLFEEKWVNCIPFPNAKPNQTKQTKKTKKKTKHKKPKPQTHPLSETHASTVHCHPLCSADKMKPQKHQELKFTAAHTHAENPKKADPQLCSAVEKRTISCSTQNQETLFFSVQLCIRNLGPGRGVGAGFHTPAFYLLPPTTALWT